MKKYRICRRYNPSCGTWYVIQKRIFFFWKTLNLVFGHEALEQANFILNSINIEEIKEKEILEIPLIYEKGNFVEKYPCKTKTIKI